MEIESSFVCAYCFQTNHAIIDGSAGTHQEYIEDCEVCCRPNHLSVTIDADMQNANVVAEFP